MPNWIEETKNTIDWDSYISIGWFSSWFIQGWFSGWSEWTEEIKETITWIEE